MSKKFQQVMKDISSTLKDVYNAHSSSLVPGGGTFAMEAVARQFGSGQKCLVVRNGYFSFRWSQIFETGGFASKEIVCKASGKGAKCKKAADQDACCTKRDSTDLQAFSAEAKFSADGGNFIAEGSVMCFDDVKLGSMRSSLHIRKCVHEIKSETPDEHGTYWVMYQVPNLTWRDLFYGLAKGNTELIMALKEMITRDTRNEDEKNGAKFECPGLDPKSGDLDKPVEFIIVPGNFWQGKNWDSKKAFEDKREPSEEKEQLKLMEQLKMHPLAMHFRTAKYPDGCDLVIPLPRDQKNLETNKDVNLLNIRKFHNTADLEQLIQLWKLTAEQVLGIYNGNQEDKKVPSKVHLSTHGLSVPWLHMRVETDKCKECKTYYKTLNAGDLWPAMRRETTPKYIMPIAGFVSDPVYRNTIRQLREAAAQKAAAREQADREAKAARDQADREAAKPISRSDFLVDPTNAAAVRSVAHKVVEYFKHHAEDDYGTINLQKHLELSPLKLDGGTNRGTFSNYLADHCGEKPAIAIWSGRTIMVVPCPEKNEEKNPAHYRKIDTYMKSPSISDDRKRGLWELVVKIAGASNNNNNSDIHTHGKAVYWLHVRMVEDDFRKVLPILIEHGGWTKQELLSHYTKHPSDAKYVLKNLSSSDRKELLLMLGMQPKVINGYLQALGLAVQIS